MSKPTLKQVLAALDRLDEALRTIREYVAGREDAPSEPAEPAEPAKRGPTFGIDISEHNDTLDLASAYAGGYRFVWIKVSEGPYRDGTHYVNPDWPRQYREAKAAGFTIGLYFYVIENNPKNPTSGAADQVELFLRFLRAQNVDPADVGIAADFERYDEPYFYLTPSNETLEATGKKLREKLGERPLTLYSSETFWNGEQTGTVASGKWSRYGFDVAWVAEWRRRGPEPTPKSYYERITDDLNPLNGHLGGKAADIGQFCIGRVAGLNIDCNVFAGSIAEYRELTVGAEAAAQPSEDNDLPEPKPKPKPIPDQGVAVEGEAWNPVTGRLAPPGFIKRPPQPNAVRYDRKFPTRFIWRPDVEKIVRDLYREFGKYNIFVNTYVRHPATIEEPRPNVSLDVWGGGGNTFGARGIPLPPSLGAEVFAYLFNMKGEPDIAWIIYHETIYGNWSGYAAEDFGDGSEFTAHDDHIHVTYEGPFQQIT